MPKQNKKNLGGRVDATGSILQKAAKFNDHDHMIIVVMIMGDDHH